MPDCFSLLLHTPILQDMNDNIEERINKQKALSEIRKSSFFLSIIGGAYLMLEPCSPLLLRVHTSQEMNDNIEERINLQKALFEIEDANVYNK